MKMGLGRDKGGKLVGLTRGSLLLKVYDAGDEIIGVTNESSRGWWCEVYRTDEKDRPLNTIEAFPVELDLVSNRYDLKVHYLGMEMWVHGVFIEKGKTTSLTLTFNEGSK